MNSKLKFLFGLALIIISLIAVYLAAYKFFGTFIRGWDGQMYYAQLRSIVVDRDLDFENELTRLTPHKKILSEGYPKLPRTKNGKILNYFTFGWAVITLPPFLLTHLICKIFCPDIASGYSLPYNLAFSFWHVLLAIISIVFIARASLKLGISKNRRW